MDTTQEMAREILRIFKMAMDGYYRKCLGKYSVHHHYYYQILHILL